MKTIIAGGRDFRLGAIHILFLSKVHRTLNITEVVSGGARGVDTDGEIWAKTHEIPIKRFPARWDKYGKAAGAIRNAEMAEYADAVILFPGGRGTSNMEKTARSRGLVVIKYNAPGYEEPLPPDVKAAKNEQQGFLE